MLTTPCRSQPLLLEEPGPRHHRTIMQRDTSLRDPFATEDESSASEIGRAPERRLRIPQNQLRNADERCEIRSPQPVPGPGLPRSIAVRTETAATSKDAPAPAPSLSLSLGLPRSRTKAHSGQTSDATNITSTARQADDAVRNTDSDALLSRLSALKLGYLPSEPFTQEFSSTLPSNGGHPTGRSGFPQPHHPGSSIRRSPLINIGTYLRCSTIDAEVESFLRQGCEQKQIISVGAGSDSRYWRIMADTDLSRRLHHYVEIDFEENTSQKLSRILKSPILRASLDTNSSVYGVPLSHLSQFSLGVPCHTGSESRQFDVIRSSKYSLLAADVRSLHPDTPSAERIDLEHLLGPASTGLDSTLPTLILFECVLAYIAPDRADWLIRHLGQRFAAVQALSYDIALAGDAHPSAKAVACVSSESESSECGQTVGTADSAISTSTTVAPPAPPSRFGRVMLQNLEVSCAQAHATHIATC